MSENQVVDLTSLKTLSGDDNNLMKMHINTFLQFAPGQVELLRAKLTERNWEEVRQVAHKLKPKLGYMGIKSLVPLVERIEQNAQEQNNLEELPDLVDQVDTTCTKAFDELQYILKAIS